MNFDNSISVPAAVTPAEWWDAEKRKARGNEFDDQRSPLWSIGGTRMVGWRSSIKLAHTFTGMTHCGYPIRFSVAKTGCGSRRGYLQPADTGMLACISIRDSSGAPVEAIASARNTATKSSSSETRSHLR